MRSGTRLSVFAAKAAPAKAFEAESASGAVVQGRLLKAGELLLLVFLGDVADFDDGHFNSVISS